MTKQKLYNQKNLFSGGDNDALVQNYTSSRSLTLLSISLTLPLLSHSFHSLTQSMCVCVYIYINWINIPPLMIFVAIFEALTSIESVKMREIYID